MKITLRSSLVRASLLGIALTLTVLSLVGHLSWLGRGEDVGGVARILNVGIEDSVPTWWSSVQLALAALLLLARAMLARERGDPHAPHWALLTAGFAVMSVDEMIGLHERAKHLVPHQESMHGVFRFAWVIPGIALVSFLSLAFARFLLAIPRRRSLQFVAGGAVFLSGCIVMEMIGGRVYDAAGSKDTLLYVLCFHLEEFLEMTGIALFAAAMVEELDAKLAADSVSVYFKGP